ncbi:TIGR01777 family protein [filamentous cyanobacterium LEGE 11480]|uniref:TIGR01777 family protein n=1 Tax=Romeriopsis navalis LEGE 11480 TaxID=2777977 RepID=A0A928VMS7_9CYAN|nr:TIGR01777 family oxidoreductase [Romeriopsis navalis]MBE9030563.1 TIGR01777 family protein [Romeriopsis navalis LEGE 11480]
MKVAITGATGFVGSRLVERLQSLGHAVVILTRNADKARQQFPLAVYKTVEVVGYDPTQSGDWQQSIAGCDGVVNLAGTPIAEEKWTPAYKQQLVDSRVGTTEKLVEAIAQANPQPTVLVSASAIGFYGTSETAEFDETAAAGNDFLADVCQKWEAAASGVKERGTRLAILRFGIVLGLGGALGKMLTPFKMFAGGPIGSGKQWFSWIHLDDVVNLIIKALEDSSIQGVYNATAPAPVRMTELCTELGKQMKRPSWLPVPGFAIEALLGDGAIVVLEGQKVMPKQTLAAGFEYEYKTIDQALAQVLTMG